MPREKILKIMEKVKVASKHDVAELMDNWKEGASRINNTKKILDELADLHQLEKCEGFFRLPGSENEYKEHSQLLTKALIKILKFNINSIIRREINIPEIGLRPDSFCLIAKDGKALCIWLEVCNSEKQEYLTMKLNAFNQWEDRLKFLSKLFGGRIPHYDIVISGDLKGGYEFNKYLKEVICAQ